MLEQCGPLIHHDQRPCKMGTLHTCTQREDHGKMEGRGGWSLYKPRNAKDGQQPPEARNRFLSQPQEEPVLPARSRAPGLQTVGSAFHCLSPGSAGLCHGSLGRLTWWDNCFFSYKFLHGLTIFKSLFIHIIWRINNKDFSVNKMEEAISSFCFILQFYVS